MVDRLPSTWETSRFLKKLPLKALRDLRAIHMDDTLTPSEKLMKIETLLHWHQVQLELRRRRNG